MTKYEIDENVLKEIWKRINGRELEEWTLNFYRAVGPYVAYAYEIGREGQKLTQSFPWLKEVTA